MADGSVVSTKLEGLAASADQSSPPETKHHDLLLIRDELDGRPVGRLDRFRVDKVTGRFPTAEVGLCDEGHRPTMTMGGMGAGTDSDPKRGPVLSTLPLHPSPAASSASTCYLVNAQNLNYTTPWTAAEWNCRPRSELRKAEQLNGSGPAGWVGQDVFSLLIASPAGRVYYLEKKGDCGPGFEYESECFSFREVELRGEPEIWGELRNGCVVGNVVYEGKAGGSRREKVVPLVNIDSLTPRN